MMILFQELEKENPRPIPLNYLHEPEVWNTVQRKNNLSTFQPKRTQNKMTALFKNLLLQTGTHHSSGNISSNSCGSLSSFHCLFLSRPSHTVPSAVPVRLRDEPHQKIELNLEEIRTPPLIPKSLIHQSKHSSAIKLFGLQQAARSCQPVAQQNQRGDADEGANKGVLRAVPIMDLKPWL